MDRALALQGLREAAQIVGLSCDVVLPDDRNLVIDEMRFHYLSWPGADQPVVVFLHGGGLTAHTWDMVCLGLRNDYHCLALDQRGHGDSDWAPDLDYSRNAHTGDIEAFLETLWLGRVVLVGQSMGGINAMTFAARHPRNVAALVLVDVGPDVQAAGAQRISEFVRERDELPSVEHFVERAAAFNPRRHRTLLRRSLLHNLRQLENGNWTWKHDGRRFMDGKFVERTTRDIATLWDDVAQITCPTLVVRGSESDVLSDEQAQHLADALPDGRWTSVYGAGHNVQGDNPIAFTEVVRGFLSEAGISPSPGTGPWQAA
jgi:esterase